jgi:hypothetical protein
MNSMTLKQHARWEFWQALAQYKQAVEVRKGIVAASIRLHAALSQVPKRFRRIARREASV